MSDPVAPLASERIVRARGAMSQAELARRAGVTRQTLNQIERGLVVPRVDTALRLAGALGCSLESLFGPAEAIPVAKIPVYAVGSEPEEGSRVNLARIDGRWLAYPSDAAGRMGAGLAPADGIYHKGPRGEFVETRVEARHLEENLFVAGCDPALPLLCEAATRSAERGCCVWIPCGSSTALKYLANGEVHLAGIHFGGAGDGANRREIDKAGLSGACTMMRFSRWEQGWMIRKDVDFSDVGDLEGGRIRLSNREKGSGCRRHLDQLLKHHGIASRTVAGYDEITVNHADCARRVALGYADVGLGCRSVARVFGLRFVPLDQVAFDLVLRHDQMGRPLLSALINLMTSQRFVASVAEIPGYETSDTGRVLAG